MCRWGGEEFAVLFDHADRAEQICTDILQVFRTQGIKLDTAECRITVSIGLVVCRGKADAKTIVNTADECLYRSKEDGRNRLTVTEIAES